MDVCGMDMDDTLRAIVSALDSITDAAARAYADGRSEEGDALMSGMDALLLAGVRYAEGTCDA